MSMLPVATTVQRGAPKINAYVLCEGHLYEVFLVLAETRLILEQVLGAVLK